VSARTRGRTTRTAGRSGRAGAWRALWGFLRGVVRVVRALRAEFGRNDPPGSYRVGPGGAALIGPKNTRGGGGSRGGGLGGGGGFGRADGADRFAAFQASRPDLFPDLDQHDDLTGEDLADEAPAWARHGFPEPAEFERRCQEWDRERAGQGHGPGLDIDVETDAGLDGAGSGDGGQAA
jgi:hypothetical protein